MQTAFREIPFYVLVMERISTRVPILDTRVQSNKISKQYFAWYFSIQVSRGRFAFGIQ